MLKAWPGLRYCPHHPTPRQAAFLAASLVKREVMFGGAAGGGKSDALLMAALMYVHVPGYSAIIFRKTYSDLALPGAIMDRSREWLTNTDAVWNDQRKTWSFPSGATLAFGYLQHAGDELRYQGAEFQYVAFDEVTQFEQKPYTYLFSRLRRVEGVDIPIRMVCATNPGGVGHYWVNKRFRINRTPSRTFIPSKLADNPHLDRAEYELSLGELDDTLRRQLLDGDWDAVEGLAFSQFRPDLHVVEPFPVTPWFDRFEFMDHGTANPAAWFVAATDHDGNVVVFDSIYHPGLVSEHCARVLERRPAWYPTWVDADGRERRPQPGSVIADPAVRQRTGGTRKLGDPATIQTEYLDQSDNRIVLAPGNNDPRAGLARVNELMRPDPKRPFPSWHPRYGETGSPRLFIVGARCPELVEQLQSAPLLAIDSGRSGAGEIVDPDWEGKSGHAVAALRYGCMSRPNPTPPPPDDDEDPRVELLRKAERNRETPPRTWRV